MAVSKVLLSGPTGFYSHGWAAAHYSYGFVLSAFEALLSSKGVAHQVLRYPEAASALVEESEKPHVHLACQPPDQARLIWNALNICLFAWEFDRLPQWPQTTPPVPGGSYADHLALFGETWTHSKSAVKVIGDAGIESVRYMPTPIDTGFWTPAEDAIGQVEDAAHLSAMGNLAVHELVARTGVLAQTSHESVRTLSDVFRAFPPGGRFVYVANPDDYRKNLGGLVAAFEAHVEAHPDSVLLLKLTTQKSMSELQQSTFQWTFRDLIRVSSPNILVVPERLSLAQLRALMRSCDFYVCPTRAEGQNQPLQQAMSAGLVCISPRHTAMADYIRIDNSIQLESHETEVTPLTHPAPSFWGLRWHEINVVDLMRALDTARALNDEDRRNIGGSARSTVVTEVGYEAVFDRLLAVPKLKGVLA